VVISVSKEHSTSKIRMKFSLTSALKLEVASLSETLAAITQMKRKYRINLLAPEFYI